MYLPAITMLFETYFGAGATTHKKYEFITGKHINNFLPAIKVLIFVGFGHIKKPGFIENQLLRRLMDINGYIFTLRLRLLH